MDALSLTHPMERLLLAITFTALVAVILWNGEIFPSPPRLRPSAPLDQT